MKCKCCNSVKITLENINKSRMVNSRTENINVALLLIILLLSVISFHLLLDISFYVIVL